jgi:hypothetical protein
LLLKTKDAAVDRLPSIRLDVDFFDKHGPVILPVESPVALIDARPERPPARPVAALESTLTLDDRTLGEGKLLVEVKTTGKGVVPAFDELFDFAPAGFKIDSQDDSGSMIARFDSEGDELAGASERTWLIKLSGDANAGRTADFAFPKPKRAEMKATYKRYHDADLVETEPQLALAGLPLQRAKLWRWGLLGGATVVILALLVRAVCRRERETDAKPAYELPAALTPFNALQLLRKMHADERLAFSHEQRSELSQLIATVESHFFAANGHGTAPDLESIGRQWVGRARELAR